MVKAMTTDQEHMETGHFLLKEFRCSRCNKFFCEYALFEGILHRRCDKCEHENYVGKLPPHITQKRDVSFSLDLDK